MLPEEIKVATFREWAENTTAHGFSELIRARSRLEKAIWLVLILICNLIMCDQLYRGLLQYSKNEWEISIKEQPKTHMLYPMLILCNINRLKYSKTKEYGLTNQMISYIFRIQHFMVSANAQNWTDDGKEEFVEWRKLKKMTYLEIFDKMGPTCEDIFLEDVCGHEQFDIEPVDTIEYGRCWKYNPPQPEGGRKIAGTIADMVVVLSAQLNEYLPTIPSNHIDIGLALQVSYTGTVHLGQWIILNPGMRTSVGLTAVEKTVRKEDRAFWNPLALMDSKPPCDMNPTMPFSKEMEYSLGSCIVDCGSIDILRNCQCLPFVRNSLYRTCEPDEVVSCFDEGPNTTLVQPNEDLSTMTQNTNELENPTAESDKCTAGCGIPCKMRYLETQTSTVRFRADQQEPELQKLLVARNVTNHTMQDLIILDIYFTSISVKVQELYEVMSFDNFISSSGGLIGLWAGMSVLTLFQAISYLVKFLLSLKRHKNDSKSNPTDSCA